MKSRSKKLRAVKKYQIIVLLVIASQLFSCLHLKYRSPRAAREYSVLAKCEDIEGYLDLFKNVVLGGLYTSEESGYVTISPGGQIPFVPEAYLNFVHLSDVQLCDERAYLFGGLEMDIFDALVDALRHGQDQEKYDYAVFKSILLGIDSYAKQAGGDRPSFLMHTGDSVHMSLVSELWEFLYLFDQSLKTVPWFNVIGNHDVTVLGTPISRNRVWLKNPSLAFLPISSSIHGGFYDPTNFISFHRNGTFLFSGIPVYGPLQNRTGLDSYSPGVFDPDTTEFQGFDMLPDRFRIQGFDPKKDPDEPDRNNGGMKKGLNGYYSFDCKLMKKTETDTPLENVRIIVLNTSEYVSSMALGGVSDSQIDWLKDILDGLPDERTRVVAFGHHPLIGGEGNMRTDREHMERLKTIQSLFKNHVDVYFCGHTHEQGYNNDFGFLQIMGPSLLVFPQSGHKVQIEYGREHMRIHVVPFSHLEMQHEDVLRQNIARIAALWESDADVVEALESIVSLWKKDRYLKTRDINDIAVLWETDKRAKAILEEIVKKYGKKEDIRSSLRKAVLLKHAYLGRVGAMKDIGEANYLKLGTNYEFIIPLFRRQYPRANTQSPAMTSIAPVL